jgi:hypothetical protein
MKHHRRIVTLATMVRLCLMAASLGATTNAYAQRLFHDKERDEAAQKAAAAAKQITSGALFDSMLRNEAAQAKFQVDTVLAFVEQQMRAKLNAFERWHDPRVRPPRPGDADFVAMAVGCNQSVECVLLALRQKHETALRPGTADEIAQRLEDIKKKRELLRERVEALAKEAKTSDPAIVRAFAALDDPGRDLIQQAEEIATLTGAAGVVSALEAISGGLDQVLALYDAVAGIWRGKAAVSVPVSSLRPPPEQAELQLLAVEQEYLKARARVEARRRLEVGAALGLVSSALASLKDAGVQDSAQDIESTLGAAAASHDRKRLSALLTVLHEASAAVAQMDAAQSLAELRTSQEERRYSIRQSAVNARTYDATIQAAVERLGLYWKSGLKPAELASFAFYLANTIAIPAIAIQQE